MTAPDDTFPRADHLETLNEIGRAVAATLDLDVLYETIYREIGRVMDTRQFFIALHRPETRSIELPYHREEGRLYRGQTFPFADSVTCLVIERGTPLLFEGHQDYQQFAMDNGLPVMTVGEERSEAKIWVPLNTGNRTIGAMSVQSTRPNAYTPGDLQVLSVIASQAAVALENARLYARSRSNVRQTHALLNVAQTINSSLDLQVVLDSILSGMREVIPYYLAAILLPDVTRGHLDIVGTAGPMADERRSGIKIPFGTGVTGRVFVTGQPLIIQDVTQFEGYIGGVDGVQSELALPLCRGDLVVGVLDVERAERDSFTPEDLSHLTLFASQAAIAIENARLYSEQRQRVDELQTIQSIVQKLTPLHEIHAIAAVIDQELEELIDYHACRIFLLDHEQGVLRTVADDLSLKLGEGIAGWIAEQGRSTLIPNTLLDERVTYIPGTPLREESMIGAPLTYEGRTRGVITLSKLGIDEFDENALRLLEIVAAQAAIALDRARLYEELRVEAVTDPLTKLHNRRYLLERFTEEKSRATRNRHTLTALMLDIDKFKHVNDNYGHDAGDVVLRELAQVVRGLVRAEDLVARYGGEEFCVLLPEIPLPDAERVAERLRVRVEEHEMPASAGVRHVTVSIGLATLTPADGEQELFTRADLAMYEVKHRGGNRVCVVTGDGAITCLGDTTG